jgi:CheY-like chemotaxis protein
MATVLVVEDEAVLLVLAESVIKSAGYETLTASSLSQAQALIGSQENFDLVVTDINLGDDREAGIHIGQLVRQLRPQTPVLYTSGFNMTDGLKELFVDNSEFLDKPYTDLQLIEAMARLLRSPTPLRAPDQ